MPDETSSTPIAPDALLAGRYRLVRRLARGGMAEVWEGTDEVLSRPVAVKLLFPHLAADDAFVTRFRREAVAAAQLSDPHIVSVYDTCSDGQLEAIVMELVRGKTLRDVLDEHSPLPPEDVVRIGSQVAGALDHAHRNGLVHRDVKPGNILLSDDGRVLVTDFGIAKAAEATSDLTEVGQVVGTAKYLSPEQVNGSPLDARSDVYGLGVVLYEMSCGKAPFAGDNATATAVARLTSDPVPPNMVCDVPPALERVILRAMARDAADRYQSAAELRTALLGADLSSDDRTSAIPASELTSVLPPSERTMVAARPAPAAIAVARPSYAGLLALLAVVALTLGLVGYVIGRSQLGQDVADLFRSNKPSGAATTGGTSSGTGKPVAITPTAFDPPPGDGQEHNAELPNLIDGNPATTWSTETYSSPLGGRGKQGVGIALQLASPEALSQLVVQSPSRGWAASVYVAATPATTLAGWGQPVAHADAIAGDHTFDLGGHKGGAVLLWITNLGTGQSVTFGGLRLLA